MGRLSQQMVAGESFNVRNGSKMIAGLGILFSLKCTTAHGQIKDTISDRKNEYANLHRSRFALLPHRNSYLLPFVYNWMPHEDIYKEVKLVDKVNHDSDFYKKNEAEFQFSFTFPIVRNLNDRKWDIMVAYTHHAWWQVYNSDWSRPFRETNYTPEVFSRYVYNEHKKIFGLELLALDAGYMHQSNGQIQALSRSWDRLFVRSVFNHEDFTAMVSVWYRLPERKDRDENHDIYNYMGIGDLELIKDIGVHKLHYKIPIFAHHVSHDLKYSYPIEKGLRWYLSFQSGYGHSLIEYNRQTQRLGIGVALENFIF